MTLCEISPETKEEIRHYPVMHREVLQLLDVSRRKIIVDCTVGGGSHAHKLLESAEDAYLIGIDKDQESLGIASQRLEPFNGRFTLIKDNFSHLDTILEKLNIKGVDIFFFDLGMSTYQLTNPERGFSFSQDGPLDMRMDRNSFLSAYDLVNNLSEVELESIFRKFGEERFARRIAHFLTEARKREPISTTTQLARIILHTVPLKNRNLRIHPATRVFQALRIAVNRELESLSQGITKAVSLLNKRGRIGVISFHSLEDRIVKHTFKDFSSKGNLKIITKKPLSPAREESEENKPSRSGKLRVAEKV